MLNNPHTVLDLGVRDPTRAYGRIRWLSEWDAAEATLAAARSGHAD